MRPLAHRLSGRVPNLDEIAVGIAHVTTELLGPRLEDANSTPRTRPSRRAAQVGALPPALESSRYHDGLLSVMPSVSSVSSGRVLRREILAATWSTSAASCTACCRSPVPSRAAR